MFGIIEPPHDVKMRRTDYPPVGKLRWARPYRTARHLGYFNEGDRTYQRRKLTDRTGRELAIVSRRYIEGQPNTYAWNGWDVLIPSSVRRFGPFKTRAQAKRFAECAIRGDFSVLPSFKERQADLAKYRVD